MVLVFPLCCVVRLQPSTTIISPFVYISSVLASSKLRGLATLQRLYLASPPRKAITTLAESCLLLLCFVFAISGFLRIELELHDVIACMLVIFLAVKPLSLTK
uniref:(northern house mosquito) hypothetical protein n=1 Tax=Culex pipiens TaxID=7175 RepID=A0A8D7ZW75_CULPI